MAIDGQKCGDLSKNQFIKIYVKNNHIFPYFEKIVSTSLIYVINTFSHHAS